MRIFVVRRQIIGNHYGMALVLVMLKYSRSNNSLGTVAAQYCYRIAFIFGLFSPGTSFFGIEVWDQLCWILLLKCKHNTPICVGGSLCRMTGTTRGPFSIGLVDDSLLNEISIKKFNHHSIICVIYLLIMNIELYVANLEHLSRVIRYAKYHHIHQLIGSILVFSGCMNIYAACNILYCIRCEQNQRLFIVSFHFQLSNKSNIFCIDSSE